MECLLQSALGGDTLFNTPPTPCRLAVLSLLLLLLNQACVEVLKPTGGKVHAFVTGLPNAGSRALKMRDGNATLAEKEKQMGLLPQDNTYLTLAAQAADFNVSVPTAWRGASRPAWTAC